LEAGGGIYYTVKMTRKASASELADQAYPRLVVMAWEGTVHVESKTGYGLTGEHELKMLEAMDLLQVMAPYMGITKTLLAHVVPEEYGDRREEYIEHFTKQLIPAAKEKGAEFVDVFCDRGAFTVEETRRILSAAAAYGMKLRLHSDELADIGCSRLALEYTLYSMDHLEHLPPTIIPALANTRTVATLLPTSMLSVFSEKKPPVEELKKHGVYIGLATDLNPNNMTPSMRHVVELAVYLYKLTPLEALAAATVNAAYSLGLEGVLGRIVEGTNPGLIIWDFDSVKKIGYEWGYDTILAVVRRDGAIVYHY
ncbi:MAG: amidohydrolase family protein, partial [Desulfurococcales archaeon]|nr:amidohydrolase family protein [Desulfurococcales archaeon]